MKKFCLFLLSALITFGLATSCSKSDDPIDEEPTTEIPGDSIPADTVFNIVGTFVLDSVVVNVKTNNADYNEKVAAYLIEKYKGENAEIEFTFDEDGNYTKLQNGEKLQEGKYQFEDGILSLTAKKSDKDEAKEYKATLLDGVLEFKRDVTKKINDNAEELGLIIDDLGITDEKEIDDFKIEEVILTRTFVRK